jgi:cytidylate kinase
VPFATVCISSEDGTGAAEAAQAAARDLGLRLIDEEIVTRAAVEAGVDREVAADVEQSRSRLVRLLEGLGPMATLGTGYVIADPAAYDQPASDALRGLIRSVIEETAAGGGVMIVSHAASLALADRENVLRVLITGSPGERAGRLAAAREVDTREAERAVKRGDAARADYIKRFYGVDERPTHYDLVINTDRLTPAQAGGLIVAAAGAPAQ